MSAQTPFPSSLLGVALAALALGAACVGEGDIPSRVGKPCQTHADCACESCGDERFACLLRDDGCPPGDPACGPVCVPSVPEVCDVLGELEPDDAGGVLVEVGGVDDLEAFAEELRAAPWACAVGDLALPAGMGDAALEALPVERLRRLTGALDVRDTQLTSLDAFAALEAVGALVVERNPALARVGLPRLVRVEGDLTLVDNASLPLLDAQAFARRACRCGEVGGHITVCDDSGNLTCMEQRCSDLTNLGSSQCPE